MRYSIATNTTLTALAAVLALGISSCSSGSENAGPPVIAGARSRIPHLTYGVLYNFQGGEADGYDPITSLVNLNGTFFGTTDSGGANSGGSIFSLTPAGTEAVLHFFGPMAGPDGSSPEGNLIDAGGTLYGTTFYGGANGFGCVYSITPSGTEKVVYSFLGAAKNDGQYPIGGLVNIGGIMYGTTSQGGEFGLGTVYSVTKKGVETTLHTFTGLADGGSVNAGLVDMGGTLYGTTSAGGGTTSAGTIFSITTAGVKTTLYDFGSSSDGQYPYAPMIAVGGVLYGTTEGGGGSAGLGTVFKYSAGVETVLHSFTGGTADGALPYAALVNVNGKLYGTTTEGGSGTPGNGVVYSITKTGVEKVLHVFAGSPADGRDPRASLIDDNGTLYGTTKLGGEVFNDGVVFTLVP